MQPPLIVSLYVFAVVFLVLGGIYVLLRLLSGIGKGDRSRRSSLPSPESRPHSLNDFEEPTTRRPIFVPPPTPLTDREYWEAERYHFEHGLSRPASSPEAGA